MCESSGEIRVRVAAAIVKDNCVLLVQHTKDGASYWMLPGGGVEHGETIANGLVRELNEELCLTIRPGRLLLVNDTIAPEGDRHVLNLCFSAEILDGQPGLGEDARITDWAFIPIEQLGMIPLRPAFAEALRAALQSNTPTETPYLGNIWT